MRLLQRTDGFVPFAHLVRKTFPFQKSQLLFTIFEKGSNVRSLSRSLVTERLPHRLKTGMRRCLILSSLGQYRSALGSSGTCLISSMKNVHGFRCSRAYTTVYPLEETAPAGTAPCRCRPNLVGILATPYTPFLGRDLTCLGKPFYDFSFSLGLPLSKNFSVSSFRNHQAEYTFCYRPK
jgi:hypothetical protein